MSYEQRRRAVPYIVDTGVEGRAPDFTVEDYQGYLLRACVLAALAHGPLAFAADGSDLATLSLEQLMDMNVHSALRRFEVRAARTAGPVVRSAS